MGILRDYWGNKMIGEQIKKARKASRMSKDEVIKYYFVHNNYTFSGEINIIHRDYSV